MLGRYEKDERGRLEFVRPTLAWVPNSRLALRVHPDRLGDYTYDMTYRYRRASRVALRYQNRLGVDVTHRLSKRSYLSVGSLLADETNPDRHHASLTFATDGRLHPIFTVGATASDGRIGYRGSAAAKVGPGLHAQLAIDNTYDEETGRSITDGLRVTGTLTADLAVTGKRLIPVHSALIHDDRGGIAGRVFSTAGKARKNLRDLLIFLNGSPAARTNEDGEFFIGNLPEGVFQLELQEDNLPIELSGDGRVRKVRVAAAAVTRMDFSVSPEYGFSGRISDVDDVPMAHVLVEVLSDTGVLLQAANSDLFGLYRFDGLKPGRYELRLGGRFAEQSGMPRVSRWVDLDDGFLFDQNLTLAPDSETDD